MIRTLVLIFFTVATCISSQAQLMFDFYHVDTISVEKSCFLPLIYFETNTSVIINESRSDLRYLAYVLKSNPDMRLSLKADGETSRFDKNRKFLNQTRVEVMAKALEKNFGIDPARIIKEDFEAWVWAYHGKPRGQEIIPLENRRIICNCVWE